VQQPHGPQLPAPLASLAARLQGCEVGASRQALSPVGATAGAEDWAWVEKEEDGHDGGGECDGGV
jgi:hypothetical protein